MADDDALNGPGEPLAVRALVVKVASRCNLNCSYCYVYNHGDETWRSQPRVMPAPVVSALMKRVRSYCLRHGLSHFTLVLHGGEPLLAGEEFVRAFVAEARRVLLPEVMPRVFMQTNGTLLSEPWCRTLAELGIGVGVSLDGTPEVNDRNRVDHANRGSYAAVRRGIETFRSVTGRTPGLLSVIDPESEPGECYRHFKELGARSVDFLFPEATYQRPPIGKREDRTVIGDWLIDLFDHWFADSPPSFVIRIFDDIVRVICHGKNATEVLGTGPNDILVVDCDGSVEATDTLKVCGDGFTKQGTNVTSCDLDDALATPLVRQYQSAGRRLCSTCRACPVSTVCGGGQLAHRYRAENAFDNPSVYCHDLMKLITHIQAAVARAMPPSLRERLGITPLDYATLRAIVPTSPLPRVIGLPVLSLG